MVWWVVLLFVLFAAGMVALWATCLDEVEDLDWDEPCDFWMTDED